MRISCNVYPYVGTTGPTTLLVAHGVQRLSARDVMGYNQQGSPRPGDAVHDTWADLDPSIL